MKQILKLCVWFPWLFWLVNGELNWKYSWSFDVSQVLEPRFNAELFAQILSIPQNKTLLRRHLSTHVVALIGNETQHKKREAESTSGYVPLLPNAKVKVRMMLF